MARPSPSKTSSNPKTTGDHPGPRQNLRKRAPRAHPDNTPEATAQRGGTPKTHPTRAPISRRKDQGGL